MVAPHFHTSSEAKSAIKRIEHNGMVGSEGAPTGIKGGSSGNMTTHTEGVEPKSKEQDWVSHRGLKK